MIKLYLILRTMSRYIFMSFHEIGKLLDIRITLWLVSLNLAPKLQQSMNILESRALASYS